MNDALRAPHLSAQVVHQVSLWAPVWQKQDLVPEHAQQLSQRVHVERHEGAGGGPSATSVPLLLLLLLPLLLLTEEVAHPHQNLDTTRRLLEAAERRQALDRI